MNDMKILIVCSSSGGHIYPGLSFGKYLVKCGEEVSYLGIKNQIEEKIILNNLILIDIDNSFKKSLKNPFKTIKGIKRINQIILDYDVIIGFGGFITFLVSRCKNINKKMFYLHEANYDIGDSNKLSLKNAKSIFTSYKDINHKKAYFVGNPVVDNLNIINKRKYISFVFGSLGSKTLLDKTSIFLLNQNDNNEYLLVTSDKYFNEFDKLLKNKTNVKVIPYIDRNYLYSNTKLIFCRGGASTLSEIINVNVNCVCIPSPYVKHNHQYQNALYYFKYHCLTLVEEKEYNENKIKECLAYYQTKFKDMELVNQKDFKVDNVCLKMYLKIKNDYNKK